MKRILPFILLLALTPAMAQDAGENTAALWAEITIPDELASQGIKTTGNVEIFLSTADFIQDLFLDAGDPGGVIAELPPMNFALWFLTGGADFEKIFYIPALPEFGMDKAQFIAPIELGQLLSELAHRLPPDDTGAEKKLGKLQQRFDSLVQLASLAQLNWLAPVSEYDNEWKNLLAGADVASLDAAESVMRSELDNGNDQSGMAVEQIVSQLEDQVALYGLVEELNHAAGQGNAAAVEQSLIAFSGRLTQASEWRGGYPDESYLDTYTLYENFKFFDIAHYLYLFAFALFLFAIVVKRPRAAWLGVGAIGIGFVSHTIFLVLRWMLAGHSPTSGMFEFMALMSWSTILAFLIFSLKRESYYTGIGVLALIFGIWALSTVGDARIAQQIMHALQSPWMTAHVGLVAIEEGVMPLEFIFSLLHLFKLSGKKSDRAGMLPPAEELEKLSYRSVLVAFPFYTIGGIVAGMIWAEEAWGGWWSWEPKEAFALFVWLII
ncbi:cytochrome c biogenesis protein CcsA, partial [bacterium]|nr:cytochrome c biogenesis protein CcsA [bacterium]